MEMKIDLDILKNAKPEVVEQVRAATPTAIEVTLIMFNEFRNICDHEKKNTEQKFKDDSDRMDKIENKLKLLEQMGAPSGDGGAGLLDTLQGLIDKLRKELTEKIDDLDTALTTKTEDGFNQVDKDYADLKERLMNLEAGTKLKDDQQQDQIDKLINDVNDKLDTNIFDRNL
jgi:hypothetical protein